MPGHRFPKGHPRWGGRVKDQPTKAAVTRQQLIEHALKVAGMTPEEVDSLSPLTVMRLVMAARLKAGDDQGALLAASMLAPYTNPRLASTDLRVRTELSEKSDAEIEAEIAALDAKPSAAQVH